MMCRFEAGAVEPPLIAIRLFLHFLHSLLLLELQSIC